MSSSSFNLSIHAGAFAPFAAYLRRHLRSANQLLPHELEDVSIALVNDATMSDLHMRYMNIAGPTDVLTFPLDDENRGGEIVICVPEAKRRAKDNRTKSQKEVLL